MKIPSDILKRQQMAIEEALDMYKKSKFKNKNENTKSSLDINLDVKTKNKTEVNLDVKQEKIVIKEPIKQDFKETNQLIENKSKEEQMINKFIEIKKEEEIIKQPIISEKIFSKKLSNGETNTYNNINKLSDDNLNKIDNILNKDKLKRDETMKISNVESENHYNCITPTMDNSESKKK